MTSGAQIEASIQSLPPQDFFVLLGWMSERHMEVLADGNYEAQELESAVLQAIESPRHALDDALLADIRARSAASRS
jgi:hypothetical protein